VVSFVIAQQIALWMTLLTISLSITGLNAELSDTRESRQEKILKIIPASNIPDRGFVPRLLPLKVLSAELNFYFNK